MKIKSFYLSVVFVLFSVLFCMPVYAKTQVTISGLTAPSELTFTGEKIDADVFGTPSFDQSYSGGLNYTFYDASGTALSSTPSDAGEYKVNVSVADTTNYEGSTDIPFSIAKATPVFSNITFSPESPCKYDGVTHTLISADLKDKSGYIHVGQHVSVTLISGTFTKIYYFTTDTGGRASNDYEHGTDMVLPAGSYTVTFAYDPDKNHNSASAEVSYTILSAADTTTTTTTTSSGSSSSSGSSTSQNSGNNTVTGTWVPDGTKWQFKTSSGTVLQSTWFKTDGKWYHSDSSGSAQTGWILDNGKWYHTDQSSCAMDTGLYHDQSDSYDYYLKADGSMATGWVQVSGKWHYFNTDVAEATYVFDSATQTWIWSGTDASVPLGAMLKNAVTPDGHHVDATGTRID